MPNRIPFAINEWYHCYNRGVDKREIFENKRDYERFLLGMFVGNSETAVHISNLKSAYLQDILSDASLERGEPLVEIGTYCLMPNHFHFLLREITEGGIAKFMQKICTGYTMYFNSKRERTGSLFAGTFKSKHVPDDRYLKCLIAYIHLNPAELFDIKWKSGTGNVSTIEKNLMQYRYSSLPDFLGLERLEGSIIGDSLLSLYETVPTLSETVRDAHAYYQKISRLNLDISPCGGILRDRSQRGIACGDVLKQG